MELVMSVVLAKQQQGRQPVPNRPPFQQKRQQRYQQVPKVSWTSGQGLLGGVLVRWR